MPNKPLHKCNKMGCNNLTRERFCETHQSEHFSYDKKRGSSSQRGYDFKWQKERKTFLQNNPLCVNCLKNNKYTPATVVDHIVPHKGNSNLFWDTQNWQALCQRCHNIKTAREDGGFGR